MSARGRRILLRAGVLLGFLIVCDLALESVILSDDHFMGRPVAPFDPPLFASSQREALARIKGELAAGEGEGGRYDAELGWCNRPDSGFGEFRYDWAGTRMASGPLARTRPEGERRVLAIGCSMTHGDEVAAQESWCARLDARPDLEVANLAVAAYGTDQALMRLRRDGWGLEPDEVWLGILPSAALRVTTMFRPLLTHWSLDVAFKPRFVLEDDDSLRLVPNPAPDRARIVELLEDQEAFLRVFGEDDTWVARAPGAYAPRGSCWLQHSFSTRLLLTLRERSGRDHAACFDEGSEFERLFTAIVATTARECEQRGIAFRVVMLPGEKDLQRRSDDGRLFWEDWSERRREQGIEVLDVSAALTGAGGNLGRLFAPGGHYTAEANEIVAAALAELVR